MWAAWLNGIVAEVLMCHIIHHCWFIAEYVINCHVTVECYSFEVNGLARIQL